MQILISKCVWIIIKSITMSRLTSHSNLYNTERRQSRTTSECERRNSMTRVQRTYLSQRRSYQQRRRLDLLSQRSEDSNDLASLSDTTNLYDLNRIETRFVEMGKKRKTSVREEIFEEVDCDDEEAKGNLRVSSTLNEKSLYEILGVDKAASQKEIKKAYHKLALRLHPDKNPDVEEAKEKFQQLQKVISILGDEEKRAMYDQTGCVDDADFLGDAIQNLRTFFRSMYKKISEADIEEFEANYRGSDSEKKDLLKLFKECKGNMDRLFCCMLCSDAKLDSHRFKDIIDEAISAGKIDSTKAYKKWAKNVSKTVPPTGSLTQRKKSKKSSEDLYAIIAHRQHERRGKIDTMFSSLVHKYGVGEAVPEPSEEEFEAARRRLISRKKSKRK